MKLLCVKDGVRGGHWRREVEFPFPPFPGMLVGAHVVGQVLVCQGDLDGNGAAEVHLDRAVKGEDGMLRDQGWEYVE